MPIPEELMFDDPPQIVMRAAFRALGIEGLFAASQSFRVALEFRDFQTATIQIALPDGFFGAVQEEIDRIKEEGKEGWNK
jgi:hypothetical protein